MEAARLPMIYFDCKMSPDKTEFTSILLNVSEQTTTNLLADFLLLLLPRSNNSLLLRSTQSHSVFLSHLSLLCVL